MIKTDWSITSQYWDWTREDFLFTYSEEEKQENAVNKNNAWLIFYADYYPRYNSLLRLDTTLEEDVVISFLYYWTKSWKYIYVKNEDLALLIKWSVATATRVVKSLVDKWYVDMKIKRIVWVWTDRKLRLNPTKLILISQINQNDVSDTSNWWVIKEYIENNKINDSKIWISGNSNNPIKDDKSNPLNGESRAGELDVCARVESYADIQEVIEEDSYRINNNKLLKCIVKMCELWYQVDKKEKPIRELVEWIKEKAEIYNIKNADWSVAQWTMLQIFDQWCEYWKSKGKVTNHKNSVMRFMINYNKPYKKK